MEYLSDYGKEIIRELYYKVQVKKQELREKGVDLGSYEYQALQQREIALNDLFVNLISFPSPDKTLADKDTPSYYEYLAKEHKKPEFNQDYSVSKVTVRGLPKLLEMYKEELIATAAAWHDGVFTNLPVTTDIDDIEPATVNYNYLERQQGYRIALKALGYTSKELRMVEDDVRNSVYTLTVDSNGSNRYKELVHYGNNRRPIVHLD